MVGSPVLYEENFEWRPLSLASMSSSLNTARHLDGSEYISL